MTQRISTEGLPLVEVMARALYEAQNPPGCRNENWPTWETHPETGRQASLCYEQFGKDEYRLHAASVLAAMNGAGHAV